MTEFGTVCYLRMLDVLALKECGESDRYNQISKRLTHELMFKSQLN